MRQLISTETGSIYENDVDNSRIRRLKGTADPTPRQGPDGEWRTYHSICSSDHDLFWAAFGHLAGLNNPIEVGASMRIVWADEGVIPATITSRIETIQNIQDG